MPAALTYTCISSDAELVISTKCPMKARNTPTQNTATDRRPHWMAGSRIRPRRGGQSRGRSRVTTNARTIKCKIRYGARFVLSSALEGSYSQLGNTSVISVKCPAVVTTSAKVKNAIPSQSRIWCSRTRWYRLVPPSATHAPNTKSSCQQNGLKYQLPSGNDDRLHPNCRAATYNATDPAIVRLGLRSIAHNTGAKAAISTI